MANQPLVVPYGSVLPEAIAFQAAPFKRATVAELRKRGFDVRLAIEDDVRNREMFEAEGVPCIYLHSGYYE